MEKVSVLSGWLPASSAGADVLPVMSGAELSQATSATAQQRVAIAKRFILIPEVVAMTYS
jgi:hypothetical protein